MAVSVNKAMVWHNAQPVSDTVEFGFQSKIISIVVESDDNPKLGCEIAAQLAEHEIPVSFAIVRPNGHKFSGVLGFGSPDDADRALQVITARGIKASIDQAQAA